MKNKATSFLVFLSLSFVCMWSATGCKQKVHQSNELMLDFDLGNNRILRKTYNKNGLVTIEQEFLKDSSGSYLADGIYKEYYDNGKPKWIAFFKNDKSDSVGVEYYPNGKISGRYYWNEGTIFGRQIVYDSLGHIDTVKYAQSNGNVNFLVTYDDYDKITEIWGTAINMMYSAHPTSLKDEWSVFNHMPILDKTATILHAWLTTKDGRVLRDTTVDQYEYKWNSHYYYFTYPFKDTGTYYYYIDVKLIDSNTSKIIKEDTSKLDVKIVK